MGAWPCGKIVMLGELYGSESLSQVYGQIHTLLQEHTQQLHGLRKWLVVSKILYFSHTNASISTGVTIFAVCCPFIGFLCYDDGCHLKKFACNKQRRDTTATSKWISSMNIVVDKLHFRGHVDKWCHEHCNPNDFEDLNKVCLWVHVLDFDFI